MKALSHEVDKLIVKMTCQHCSSLVHNVKEEKQLNQCKWSNPISLDVFNEKKISDMQKILNWLKSGSWGVLTTVGCKELNWNVRVEQLDTEKKVYWKLSLLQYFEHCTKDKQKQYWRLQKYSS